ncbi:glycosyltransferase [Vibrio sp. 10N.222.51.C12]|uniref:glycosyltransferase n=1 Tax=Vibrio sp. 10N.222.51.C12 TaxID=3229622 RepID=UPI00354D4CD4
MNKLLCFVDKAGEPQHSFIDGMLAKRCSEDFDVIIYTSWDKLSDIGTKSYHNSMLRTYLFPRRGFYRLLNVILVALICFYSAFRNYNFSVVAFCRNEPSFLLGAQLVSFIRNLDCVFQSSFPHEDVGGGMKSAIAKLIFNLCGKYVKKITAVSDEGLKRMKRYFPEASGIVVPLMGDEVVALPIRRNGQQVKFVYIGTLDSSREFEVVVKAFCKVMQEEKYDVSLDIYGGNEAQWKDLVSKVSNYNFTMPSSRISYNGCMKREDLFSTIEKYDVGISLVPKNNITSEMSPTKLSEYMGCGLAVLASNTVTSQVDIMSDSQCGCLIDFSCEDIIRGIGVFCEDSNALFGYKQRSVIFVKNTFTYDVKKEEFLDFLRSDI